MNEDLTEIKVLVARIDERTGLMVKRLEDAADALEGHEKRDREDFRDVHSRINRLERKQNWLLGVGSVVITGVTAYISGLFKSIFGG